MHVEIRAAKTQEGRRRFGQMEREALLDFSG